MNRRILKNAVAFSVGCDKIDCGSTVKRGVCLYSELEVSVMAYKINPDVCVKCGVCKENCPVECIKEVDDKMTINPDECVDCGTCEGVCPVSAISAE